MKSIYAEVLIIIPMYNEEATIGDVLSELFAKDYQVLCVDDGSSDKSYEIALRAGAQVVRHLVNLGQGAALETGLEYSRRLRNQNLIVVTFDADGQHAPSDIASLVDNIKSNKADVVLGSRFIKNNFQGGKLKEIIIRFMARLALFTIRIRVTDRHNGLRAFSFASYTKLKIKNPGFGHADEILRQIKAHNLKYLEIPSEIRYTKYSKSKGQPLINGLRLVLDRFLGAP